MGHGVSLFFLFWRYIMSAQVFNFPSESTQDKAGHADASIDLSFVVTTIVSVFAVVFSCTVLYRLFGVTGVALGVIGVCFFYAMLQLLASGTASEKTILDPVSSETTRFFKDLESFRWNFEDEFRFYADKKLFWKERRTELFARANTDERKQMLKDFRAFHYAGASKPVLSNYL
jgi:hypothetical protein